MTSPEARAGESCPEGGEPDVFGEAPPCGGTSWSSLSSRSVSSRIGLAFWLLFMGCLGVAGTLFFEALQSRVIDRIDDSLEDQLDAVETLWRSEGIEAVVRVTRERTRPSIQSRMGFHLALDGVLIVGNVPLLPPAPGLSTVSGADVGLPEEAGRYRFLTSSLGDHDIGFGRSLSSLEELRAVALTCLLWTLAGSTLLAILAAVWIARRLRARLDTLRAALGHVASGDLDARIPISDRRDDIDVMSATINQALGRLSRSVDGMRQVSTDIAHDLKTPLNRLWIQIDEAAARSRRGECVGDELDVALEEARGIDATFEALLRIAQIEAGARRSRFEHFDLAAVLGNVAEIYEPVIEEQGQSLALGRHPGEPLAVLGDRELITQLVVNLIENASSHGGADVAIRLDAGLDGDLPWLTVTDDGPGIPPSERERVLQRLYRLERNRTTRGSGLGLSLVKAIVELHGGELVLGDGGFGSGRGLEVSVRFPPVFGRASNSKEREPA